MRLIVAITGASGVIYGIRLLEELKGMKHEIHLIVSENAKKIIGYETNYKLDEIKDKANEVYNENDMESKLASGSFRVDAMIICPCSIKTMAAISNGIAFNLITRAAICCLKENRKLIIIPRETPLDLISLENMIKLKKAGVVMLPAMPAFYHKPKDIDDLIKYVIGKILEQLGINHSLYRRWKE